MCGIAGVVDTAGSIEPRLIERMTATIAHRGPDDAGVWLEGQIALGHQRLSVVDLSPAGHQPMTSHSGDWVIAYNGEIYNHEEIRHQLNADWRGRSDTEVLIQAIERWGVAEACRRTVGMFAFAAYQRSTGDLYLVRDRLGIKPLYYGWVGGRFAFASELHALAPLRDGLNIDRDALASYLRHNYVPSPASIYQEIRKLPPAHTLKLSTRGRAEPVLERYWDLEQVAREPTFGASDEDLLAELETLLTTAVSDRMIADVPLGAFLSGGFDSSLVCALMQKQSSTPIKTFTIGFDEERYNEAEHAARVATHLGTDHTELYVSEADLLGAVEALPQLLDEPFADSSLLPTYLVSRLARESVTVALSGDGGDELFWGYQRYPTTVEMWTQWRRIPTSLSRLALPLIDMPITRRITRNLPAPAWGGRRGTLDQKLATAADVLRCSQDFHTLYEAMVSHWRRPEAAVLGGRELRTAYNDPDHWARAFMPWPSMAWMDTVSYLPDDILTKVDRASMAVGLEARVPLIDHRVVEFAARLPRHFKHREDTAKWALRKILNDYVPRDITDRPKMGFGVPLDDWLRGPLKTWAGDLLNETTLKAQGLFDPAPISTLFEAHIADRANNGAKLWDVLSVQLWLQRQNQSTSA